MNKIFIISERILRFLTSFLVIVMAARLFDKESLGLYITAFSLISVIQVLVDYGTQTYLVRECSESLDNVKSRNILLSSVLLKFLISIVVFFALIIYAYLTKLEINSVICILYLGVFASCLNVFDPVMISKSDGIGLFFSRVLSIVFSFSFRIYAALYLNDINFFAFAIFIEYVFIFIFGSIRLKKLRLFENRVNFYEVKNIFIRAFPLAMSSLLIIAYTRLDQLMIAKMIGVEAVADYAIGIRFTEASTFIPTVLASTFLPSLISSSKKGTFTFDYVKFGRFITVISLVLSAVMYLLSDVLIVNFFGEEYESSIDIMKISSISLVFTFQAIFTSQWFTIFRQDKFRLRRSFFGLIINIFANMIMIPKYGVLGACYATLISQIYVGVVSSWVPNKLDVKKYQIGIFKL